MKQVNILSYVFIAFAAAFVTTSAHANPAGAVEDTGVNIWNAPASVAFPAEFNKEEAEELFELKKEYDEAHWWYEREEAIKEINELLEEVGKRQRW